MKRHLQAFLRRTRIKRRTVPQIRTEQELALLMENEVFLQDDEVLLLASYAQRAR